MRHFQIESIHNAFKCKVKIRINKSEPIFPDAFFAIRVHTEKKTFVHSCKQKNECQSRRWRQQKNTGGRMEKCRKFYSEKYLRQSRNDNLWFNRRLLNELKTFLFFIHSVFNAIVLVVCTQNIFTFWSKKRRIEWIQMKLYNVALFALEMHFFFYC